MELAGNSPANAEQYASKKILPALQRGFFFEMMQGENPVIMLPGQSQSGISHPTLSFFHMLH